MIFAGRRVLVMGFGRIGREVARRCAAFGMAVMVYDPYVQANVIEAAGDYRSVPDFQAVLPETDVLTVHMPLGADSRSLIGSAELAALPDHAFVINAARGGIVTRPRSTTPSRPEKSPAPASTCSTRSRRPTTTRCSRSTT